VERNEKRKKDQAAKGLDALGYFVLCKLTDDGIPNPDIASRKAAEAFSKFPNWQRSEAELREVRKQVTFALFLQTMKKTKHWRSKQEFKARVHEWAIELDTNVAAIYIRPMRRKWASCSTAGV